jgi:hypothetical protein
MGQVCDIWCPAPKHINSASESNRHQWPSPPLSWYDAYNAVKHNRHAEFTKAGLENVRNAIAGRFALIVESSLIAQSGASMREQRAKNGQREYIYSGFDFSFVTPG